MKKVCQIRVLGAKDNKKANCTEHSKGCDRCSWYVYEAIIEEKLIIKGDSKSGSS